MTYNESSDYYVYAQGRKLVSVGTKTENSKTRYPREVTMYEFETCKDYQVRAPCTKAKAENNKRLSISKKFIELREESQNNITTDEGVSLRLNRSIQVDGFFGRLWIQKIPNTGEFQSLSRISTSLLSYNMKKLPNKIQNGRCGTIT